MIKITHLNPTNMLLIEKKVIEDKWTEKGLVSKSWIYEISKEVEVVDIDKEMDAFLHHNDADKTFKEHCNRYGYQLIKIKQ
jgi:hypothetical protein